jgi:hypothetical protein
VGHRDPLVQLPAETVARLAQHEGMQGNVGCQKAAAVGACHWAQTADMNACQVAKAAGAVVTKMTMAGDARVD